MPPQATLNARYGPDVDKLVEKCAVSAAFLARLEEARDCYSIYQTFQLKNVAHVGWRELSKTVEEIASRRLDVGIRRPLLPIAEFFKNVQQKHAAQRPFLRYGCGLQVPPQARNGLGVALERHEAPMAAV